jgi:hypothetical protein
MNLEGSRKLKLMCYFMETTYEPLHFTNEVQSSERSWTSPQVLFESLLYLTKLLNMALVRNLEVMLGQTLIQSV